MPSLNELTTPLNFTEAKHLMERISVGVSKADIDFAVGKTAAEVIDSYLNATITSPAPPVNVATGETFHMREEFNLVNQTFLLRQQIKGWWIKQCIETENPLLEKMVFFLHTHFTNDDDKVGYAFPSYHQNELFRQYAFGNFKTLARKICYDTAMSIFLDGWTNTNQEPNENFAREFLELFTIGKGPQVGEGNYTNFTEDDIREAARVLTGFAPLSMLPDAQIAQIQQFYPAAQIEIDSETGLYKSTILPFRHDAGTKTFSAAFQNQTIQTGSNTPVNISNELQALVDMIFNQDATALFIAEKLYRFFVYYEVTPAIKNDIITPLAQTLKNNDYELAPALRQLFVSQHFFDKDDSVLENDIIGSTVKSPLELVVGAFRFLGVDIGSESDLENHYQTLGILNYVIEQMDMILFHPPEVAGYPAYHQRPAYNRNWITSSTLLQRYSSFELLTLGITVAGVNFELDVVGLLENTDVFTNPSDANHVVDTLTNYLFPRGVNADKKEGLKQILRDEFSDFYWSDEWNTYVNTGDDSVVKPRLKALFKSILQSPEFQLK